MAQAEIVQKEIVVPQTADVVVLTLTPAEAAVVLKLVGGTCGDSNEIQSVYNALTRLDIPTAPYILRGRPGMWTPDNPRSRATSE